MIFIETVELCYFLIGLKVFCPGQPFGCIMHRKWKMKNRNISLQKRKKNSKYKQIRTNSGKTSLVVDSNCRMEHQQA